MEVKYLCNYCGHVSKLYKFSSYFSENIEDKCLKCGQLLTIKELLPNEYFDKFGYNERKNSYKLDEKIDNEKITKK